MKRHHIALLSILVILSFLAATVYAQEEEGAPTKAKTWWQRLFKYPARVTKKSVGVATETVEKETEVVTTEVERVGEVTSGEFGKTKELIVEPLEGTAKTATEAIEKTVKIPIEAATEEK